MNPIVRPDRKSKIPEVAAVLLVLSMLSLYFMGSGITGYSVASNIYHSDSVDIALTGRSIADVTLKSKPLSLRVSGYALGGDAVDIFLKSGDDWLLIANASSMEEVEPDLDEDISEVVSLINSTAGVSEEIRTRLDYAGNSSWDADNDGRETMQSAIDFTVENTVFTGDFDEDKLCTVWEVYSVYSGNLTEMCYGNEDCCLIYGLSAAPESSWDDKFYLPYGRYSALEKNVVGAKVVYADVDLSLESQAYTIYRGGWDFKKAMFYVPKFRFTSECLETCSLKNGSRDASIMAVVGEHIKLYLDSVEYVGEGLGGVNYSFAGIRNLNVSVSNKEGDPVGHYLFTSDGETVDLKLSSEHMAADLQSSVMVITSPVELPEDPIRKTYYKEEPASTTVASEVVIYGLRNAPGAVEAVFDDVSDASVRTGVAALTEGLEFDSMTVTLPRYGGVTVVSECVDFNREEFRCLLWEPYTFNFTSTDWNVSFTSDHSGVYAGVNVSVVDYIVEYGNTTVVGARTEGDVVTWSTSIGTQYSESLEFTALLEVPDYAENISIVDDKTGLDLDFEDVSTEGSGVKTLEVMFRGSGEYTIYYITSGPLKAEHAPVEEGGLLTKRVDITSITPYEDFIIYSQAENAKASRIRLLEVLDGRSVDITDEPRFNVSLEDVDGDGGVDWVYWLLAEGGNRTFDLVIDNREKIMNWTSEYVRTYRLSDDDYLSEVSVVPVQYEGESGWVEYDTLLVDSGRSGYDLRSSGAEYTAYFSRSSYKPVRVEYDGEYVDSTPADANGVSALVSGDTIAYYGIWAGVDLYYTVTPGRLVMEAVLLNGSSQPRLPYQLDVPRTRELREDGRGGLGVYDGEGNRLFGAVQAYAVDSVGRRAEVQGGLTVKGRDYVHTLVLDEDYLEDVVYPVSVVQAWDVGVAVPSLVGDATEDGMHSNTSSIILGSVGDDVFRGYADFNVGALEDWMTLTGLKLSFNVESPLSGCDNCSCVVNHMGGSAAGYLSTGGGDIHWDIGNGTSYGSEPTCDVAGAKEVDLGFRGERALSESMGSGLFTVGIVSSAEYVEGGGGVLTSTDGSRGEGLRLSVQWTRGTTTTLPYLYLDDISDMQSSRRCAYDEGGRRYHCTSRDIIVNGTVDLLAVGENSSRNADFKADGNFTIVEGGALRLAGRNLSWAGSHGIGQPDGGDLTVEAGEITVDGLLDVSGGSYSSKTYSMNAGDSGSITLRASGHVTVLGSIVGVGGDVDVENFEGDFGGRGGTVEVMSGNSNVYLGDVRLDAGVSNNQPGLDGGSLGVEASGSVIISRFSAAGSLSQYDSGGDAGSLSVRSVNDIEVGCVNVSGGFGGLGGGGAGGLVSLESDFGDIRLTCDFHGVSGGSNTGFTGRAANLTFMALGGDVDLDNITFYLYGGSDVGEGEGGDGGSLTLYAADALLGYGLNLSGGSSAGGTGGDGGRARVEYCWDHRSASYEDVRGGPGPLYDGVNGSVTLVSQPSWCTVASITTTTTTLPEPITVSLRDRGRMAEMGLKFTDRDGNELAGLPGDRKVQIRDNAGKRIMEFTVTGEFNLTSLVATTLDDRVFVDFERSTGVELEHSIFIDASGKRGAYICPNAERINEVYYGCPGMVVFYHIECIQGSAKQGLTCDVHKGDYRISGLT
ncbi:MAG: hypothetical protein GF416_09020 [Candidatus Altiarchaeales archaeon]|nr:hypothetical protein [Candidatus Altiarchaeales archaeon]MBD3417259.1 hypothetical protein [Candidatus Altiarchaeales archaeon]